MAMAGRGVMAGRGSMMARGGSYDTEGVCRV